MKRWSTVVISACFAFVLALAGTVRANWYVNAVPATTCINIYGLPLKGAFGELFTNPEGPYGDTTTATLSCFYSDYISDPGTGALVPPIHTLQLVVYDGDGRWSPVNEFDVRAALCLQDFYQTFWWCSESAKTTSSWGWAALDFYGPHDVWTDMPRVWNERGWGDPLVGFSKRIYVYLPPNSKFMGWNVSNSSF
jgi:hypothetical protein